MNETEQMFTLNASQPSTSALKSEIPETAQVVNLENVQDFSNVCRTCATITEFVIPIFSGEGLQNNLADKIQKHLPIKVSDTDVLPRVVCYQCASTLLAWHELVACCRHADAALRARLAADSASEKTKDPKQFNTKSTSTLEEDAQSKFKPAKTYAQQSGALSVKSTTSPHQPDTLSFQSMTLPVRPLALPFKSIAPPIQVVAPLVQTLTNPNNVINPIRFISPSLQAMAVPVQSMAPLVQSVVPSLSRQPPKYTPPHRRCDYCNTLHPEDKYSEHMMENHSELVFFCEECNRFISKSVLVIHMSLHAYGYIPKKELKGKVKKNQNNELDQNIHEAMTSEEPTTETSLNTDSGEIEKTDEQNEFSDHSDIENDFDPIPESVFEAIEDSQDIQADNASHTPEIEHLSEESNTSNPSNEEDAKKKCRLMYRTCPICSRKFTASSSYFYHMKFTHKKVKEHECDICSKKFATRGSLTAHFATHTEERRFACRECPKRFRSRASLYIHEQIHNGIKNYSCTQCDMSFRWKTQLERHMKRHAAEKVHLCSTCGRGFNVRCDLLRHMRTHTGGNFPCEKCSLVFAQLRYLKVHMNKKHSQECETNS